MRFDRVVCLSAVALTSACALGQSFNVDIDATSGAGAGVPNSAYEADANQPGFWNSITSASATTTTLKNLDGTTSSATFTRATNGSFSGGNLIIFDFGQLYNDWQQIVGGDLVYSFNNLQAGTYLVYTYAHKNGIGGPTVYTEVEVPGASGQSITEVGGFLGGNFPVLGITDSVHSKTVSAGGSITVKVRGYAGGLGVCNGFQLVKLGAGALPIRKYVDDSSPVSFGTGDSWDQAYDNVQSALTYATMVGGQNCEVWVAQGFYYPTVYQSGSDRTASFVIPSGLKFYGGFNGTETSLSQRTSPAFYITALSGAINGSGDSDNSYNVVTADGCSNSTVIDGFSIVRGYASGNHGTNNEFGGGMRIISGSPVVRNCKFISNSAEAAGAGVYVDGFSLPTFTNCLFYKNSAYNGVGGAVASAGTLNVRFANCQFLGNYAVGNGGACDFGGYGELNNCLFSGNTASCQCGYGGAIYAHGTGDTLTMRNCTISHNTCGGSYGGVAIRNNGNITFANCITWGNTDAFSPPFNANLYVEPGSTISLSFSTIQGAPGSAGLDPQFNNPAGPDGLYGTTDDDCRLKLNSPCIDAGDNSNAPADITDINQNGNFVEANPYDLDGNARRVNINSVADTGSGTAPIIDRGARMASVRNAESVSARAPMLTFR